jgi:molybdopterin-guanine dinucleotide biosynthesis adapter protein
MIPSVHFVGKSGTGKTTLIEAIVLKLKERGYRVAVVKHAHHGFEMDKPGKDSWRFGQAGSDVVAISSPGKLAMLEKVDGELDFEQVNNRLGDRFDIVLVEGFKQTSKVKIEVTGSEQNKDIEIMVDFIASHIPQNK